MQYSLDIILKILNRAGPRTNPKAILTTTGFQAECEPLITTLAVLASQSFTPEIVS